MFCFVLALWRSLWPKKKVTHTKNCHAVIVVQVSRPKSKKQGPSSYQTRRQTKHTCSSITGPHWHCLRHPIIRPPLGDVLVCLSGECHLWVTGGVSASRHGWSGRGSGVVGCGPLQEGASVDCPMRRRSSCAVWLSITDLFLFPRYYTMSPCCRMFCHHGTVLEQCLHVLSPRHCFGAMPARFVTNERVTNRTAIAPF